MRRPLGTSRGTITHAPLVLVDLETAEGVPGRSYIWAYSTAGAGQIAGLVAEVGEVVAGATAAPVPLLARLLAHFTLIGREGLPTMAISALDVACWDSLGRATGLPLVRLLGGEAQPVAAYNSMGLGLVGPERVAAEAVELLGEGFSAVKLRLGYPSAEGDLAAVRAVRRAIPDTSRLLTDYNQALSTVEAIGRARALDGEGVYWIEEPIRHDDYAGLARLAREVATPIQIGENFIGTRPMAQALAAEACDLVMPDLARIGGVTGWLRAAALADAAGVPMSTHLFPEVSAHLLAVTPTAHLLEYVDWASPVLAAPLEVRDGHVRPSAAPGVGVDWDEAAVRRYAI
jgi:mandelate racemase